MINKRRFFVNFIFGFACQAIVLGFGLVIPRVMLKYYGSDVNGLTTSIAQVFGYVALLESGLSMSAKNLLYKPINTDDKDEISSILYSTRKQYRKITYIYISVVVLLSFLLPFLLKTDVDYWTIFLVVLFEGLTSAVCFYFVDTNICFLNTCGKSYIVNIFELITKVLMYCTKIILAINGINIAYIQICFFLISIVKVILFKLYMQKKYSWIDYKCNKLVELKDRNSFVLTEIAWVIFSSTDMIVISIFLSTSMSSVYSIYNMIFISLNGILSAIYTALSYSLGKVYHEDKEKYKRLHNIFTSFLLGIATCFMCVSCWLTIPFVKLYTVDIEDINYIYKYLPLLFCMVQLLSWSRYVSGNLTSVAGYAKQVSYVSLIEAIANVVSSIVLVNFFGIYGVLIATVISLPIKVIATNYIAEKLILKRNPCLIILIILFNYLIFGLTFIFSYKYSLSIENFLQFAIYGVVLTIIYSIIVMIVNLCINADLRKILFKFIFRKRGVEKL